MSRTLLIVDDEENILAALTRILRRDGYTILRANSGQEGLELLEKNQVGVIMSDQRMPEMTGVEFLSKVKDQYPDTVRIVLSGYTDLNSVTDAINKGAIYKFLTKPWDDELLKANIREAFDTYELKKENERLTAELKEINSDLERRVEIKTREVMINLKSLQTSQEVLDAMPVAVMGISEDGIIAVANCAAHKMLGDSMLVGRYAKEVVSDELTNLISDNQNQNIDKLIGIGNGTKVNARCCRMGTNSSAKGWVIAMIQCETM